ncbi:MAG: 50S ribosomal protein L22 [Mycoplasmataceae bacterium]|jgi:ribosomal protein L22|nr:50S ribosomal protein L22 [Mycoplasmataceae bacterium]
MKTRVIQRNVNVSPRKAGLVCDLIRSKNVKQALTILTHTEKKTADILRKMLNSAIANATHNHGMKIDDLYIYNTVANKGTYLKRTLPRARGSADIMLKRYSHLEIILSDDPQQKQKDLLQVKSTNGTNPNKNTIQKENISIRKEKK